MCFRSGCFLSGLLNAISKNQKALTLIYRKPYIESPYRFRIEIHHVF